MMPASNHLRSLLTGVALGGLAVSLVGCSSTKRSPSTKPVVTSRALSPDDPRLADADFWWSQPAHASVRGDFDPLWSAAERCLKDLFFEIDRRDWRSGVLSTRPMISAQWFEPWRGEVASSHARTSSTLATERRTARIDLITLPDGTSEACPRVLVEREAVVERQITSSALTRGAFSRRTIRGSLEADRGIELPDRYWYAVGRDPTLEKRLAARIQQILAEQADTR